MRLATWYLWGSNSYVEGLSEQINVLRQQGRELWCCGPYTDNSWRLSLEKCQFPLCPDKKGTQEHNTLKYTSQDNNLVQLGGLTRVTDLQIHSFQRDSSHFGSVMEFLGTGNLEENKPIRCWFTLRLSAVCSLVSVDKISRITRDKPLADTRKNAKAAATTKSLHINELGKRHEDLNTQLAPVPSSLSPRALLHCLCSYNTPAEPSHPAKEVRTTPCLKAWERPGKRRKKIIIKKPKQKRTLQPTS